MSRHNFGPGKLYITDPDGTETEVGEVSSFHLDIDTGNDQCRARSLADIGVVSIPMKIEKDFGQLLALTFWDDPDSKTH